MEWPFYELCQSIYGKSALANAVRLSSSLAAVLSSPSSSSPSPTVEDADEADRDTQVETGAEASQGMEADNNTDSLIQAETTRTWPLQTSGRFIYVFFIHVFKNVAKTCLFLCVSHSTEGLVCV